MNTSASLRLIAFAVLVCIGIGFPCLNLCRAQVAASVLNGTVTDPTGAAVPNCRVTITSPTTGFSRSVLTGSSGTFSIPDLTPSVYDVSAEAEGFKKAVAPKLTLQVGQTTTQDFRLELGQLTQQVTVSAQTPLLNTTSGQLGTVVTSALMTQLPLNGRNFLQLNLLSPGTINDKNSNTTNDVSIDPSVSQATFSVNGQKSDYNIYLVDGVDMKEWEAAPPIFHPSVDAIQEFQTTTSNYAAAFGVEAGAQVNLVIKSGTNRLHGTAWEYLRNNMLDARNFFEPSSSAPPFKRNQFGFNLGGPVYLPRVYNGKDKSFFFFNYEGFRQVRLVPEQGFFPTPAQLAGDLSTVVTPGSPLIDPFTGQPFSSNAIPPDRIRPATLEGFLQNGIGKGPWIPAPNTSAPGVNFTRDSPFNYSKNQYITRVDHNFGSKTSAYGHFVYQRESKLDPEVSPTWSESESINSYSIAGHVSRVIKPNFLFEVGTGLNHILHTVVQSTAFKNDITNKILGIKGDATVPASWGAPVWSVAGYSNLGEVHYGPREWYGNVFDLKPNFTLSKGRHNLKWGMDLMRINQNFPEIFATNGEYSYDGRFTGYPLGDFLLGLPGSIFASTTGFAPDTYNSALGPYFQDDWKVTPNLTLNLGLRYEWIGIPLSDNHRSISNIFFPSNNGVPEVVIANGASPINFQGAQQTFFTGVPFVRASSVGLPPQLGFNDNKDFGPRLGFAYKLPRFSDTVFRGGYGVFYVYDIMDKWIEASVDPPFVSSLFVALDQTNFRSFDPLNPYANAESSAAQVFGNEINHKLGRVQEWNFSLQRTAGNTLFSLAYVGNIDDHLADLEEPNQAVPGPGAIESRRRWPSQGVLFVAGENGISNYNGLQAKVQHDFSKGLALLASYTWSRTLDNTGGTFVGESDRGNPQNFLNSHGEYGLAGQHAENRFVVSYVYELPVGKGKRFLSRGGAANAVLGGWQINGITAAVTGNPQSAFQVFNVANTDVGSIRPDLIGNPNDLSHSRPRGQQVAEFFDTAAFRQADLTNGPYRFGNAGRHIIIGPGTYDYDFALYKNFRIKESGQIQFRAEFFNLFNRPIFGAPGSTLGTPQFGVLTYTSTDSREIQFALRLSF